MQTDQSNRKGQPHFNIHIYEIWQNTVCGEVREATKKFGTFNSFHEGYAVLKEEMDELWDEIKKNDGTGNGSSLRREAIQTAAMAMRFLYDLCMLPSRLSPKDGKDL